MVSGTTWKRVTRSTRIGLSVGVLIAVMASIAITVGLGPSYRGLLEALLTTAILYVGGGVVGGAIVGLVRPIASRSLGAALIGVLASAPFFAGTAFAVSGFEWTVDTTITLLIVTVVLGAPLGVVWARLFAAAGRA